MPQKPYQRGDTDEARMQFHGVNTVLPPDRVPLYKYPFAQNVRAYLNDAIAPRATQDSSVETLPTTVHTLRRLNDTTPAGPATGFILIGGAGTELFAGITEVDSGLSGNPLSLVPFRPNTSVQPWMYVGDSVKMDKVRSDGLRYKMGIAEPQSSPAVTFVGASDRLSLIGPVTVSYWGDSPHSGPVGNYIWRNAGDVSGGPVRSSVAPNGVATGNSLMFDILGIGDQEDPVQWTQFKTYSGTVNTDVAGNTVGWVSGDFFTGLIAGDGIVINAVSYTIAAAPAPTDTVLHLTTNPGSQVGVRYLASSVDAAVPLFTPALESEGYSDFNFVAEATLYVPAAGAYTLSFSSKDETLWGIGSSATGTASWSGPSGGTKLSIMGQRKTAINAYPLMPKTVVLDGAGQQDSGSVLVNFTNPGNYPIEVDFDYWYHSGRHLRVKANGNDIAPIPGSAITNAQYRYVYRSSATGAVSNPSPASGVESLSVLSNSVVAVPSNDPQVDKIDFYRLDSGLTAYTYVGTGPNNTTPFVDKLLDTDIANNPVLEFDNFEPFPSIDLPKKGTVNVAGGVATWASGDKFNIRWLPGTIIIVGGVAYTLNKRPTSTTTLTATNEEIVDGVPISVPLASGNGQVYEIAEPILAAQPLPYMWGPTDNVNFAFACGDPLRPGTLYWCKGNNLDSAPDTNQEDVTSPSEPLQNGCIVNGLGLVFSTERAWLIFPNFFNALATVQGTVGSTWTLQESISTRGLYMPNALAVDGGGNVFFRAKDGIYISPGGQGAQSITDDIYNLFPHEGYDPQPIVRGGYVIWPPDDTKPHAQTMSFANGYLYYDYRDVNNEPRTLVFDIAAKGWVIDEYEHEATVHMLEEGANVNGVLTGCLDGGVRPLVDSGAENECAILLMPCFTAGDVRAQKHFGDLYVEAGFRGEYDGQHSYQEGD
jgi:hypothetical protein